MTYEELKVRLTSVETTLQQLQTTESTKLSTTYIEDSIEQLNIVRENILSKMKIIEEGDETMFVSTKGGDTKAVKMDRKAAMDLKKDPAITGIDTAKGAKIKEAEDKGVAFSTTETKLIAKSVGKALIITLKKLGDEIARIKAHRIEENSFDIFIDYKAEKGVDEFSFYIKEDMLHLVDFSFDKELVEVGVKPSGEAIVNVDVLSNELLKHFKSLSEGGDYDPDQEQKDDEEDHGVGYDDEGRPLGEGEGDDHHYIKVKAHDYKKAMAILDQNVDPTYVKMEVIDNDGAGNVIIYFIFKHESGFDDMYDDSENQDSEFYQEPDEDPQAFVYDVVMDLGANDITVVDSSTEMDEILKEEENSDSGKLNKIQTFGDLQKFIKLTKTKIVAKKVGGALDAAIGFIPGIGNVKTGIDVIRALAKKQDGKTTNTFLDKMDVDDKASAIVDDKVEANFINYMHKRIEDQDANTKLPSNFNMNSYFNDFLSAEYDKRTIDGINEEIGSETILEDATDIMLEKFPTLKAVLIRLQTEDFKEFVNKIDWISPRPTEFRINLTNGQDYILKWTGKGFEAQILGKRYFLNKINEFQQALDKLAILYKEGPMGEPEEPAEPAPETDSGSSSGSGGDFPGEEGGGDSGEDTPDGDDTADAGEEEGADLTDEPVDFEEPAEEPEA